MQPTYIPWIGYFDMIDSVDVFVFLDDVQLERRSWQVRNRLKGANGEVWLTLPIKKTRQRDYLVISGAVLDNDKRWIKKHLKTIELNYCKAPFYDEVFPIIKSKYDNPTSLRDFNVEIIKSISENLGVATRFVCSSSLDQSGGSKDDKLVGICKALGADSYLSPKGSLGYIDRTNKGGSFVDNDIDLYYHNYLHPLYKQQFGDFIPYMGIYDLLFNEGINNSLEILRKGRRDKIYYSDMS